jgi:GNAT superfamily N-acetyltransferase
VDQFVARRFRKYIRSRNAAVFIATEGAHAVGFATISIEKNKVYFPPRFGMIGYLYVRKPYRGRRVSSKLMDEIRSWLATRQIANVGLGVLSGNLHARSVYKNWGFIDAFLWMWKP